MNLEFWNFLGAVVAGGGLFALISAVLRFAMSRNKQADAWVSSEFQRLGNRVDVLEIANRDCMERERALVERVGKLEALESIARGGPVAYIVADTNGTITEWSAGATALLGWSHDEAVGQNVTMLIPMGLRQRHGDAFSRAVAEHRGLSAGPLAAIRELFSLRKDGSEIPVTIMLSSWTHGEKRFFSAEVRKR